MADSRSLLLILLCAALIAAIAGCSKTHTPITLPSQVVTERSEMLEQTLRGTSGPTKLKLWKINGEEYGARILVINDFKRNGRHCKEYFLDTFHTKSGNQVSDQEHATRCHDPQTDTWIIRG